MVRKTMQQLRDEIGIVPQGKTRGGSYVLFHLAFRMDEDTAKRFMKTAAREGLSESLWARQAILEKLDKS